MSTAPTELTLANTQAELRAALEAPTPPPEPQPAAAPPPAEPVAAPPPAAPEWGQLVKNTDGTYQVTLATGEVFKGTPDEVIAEQAKAHVNTKRWAQGIKDKAGAPAEPAAPAAPPAENPEDIAARDWVVETLAKALNVPKEQFVQLTNQMFENNAKTAQAVAWTDFMQSCPDYADSPQNAEVLVEYLPQEVIMRQRQPNLKDFKKAHAEALYDKKYSAAATTATVPGKPPVPPVMPSSGASQPTAEADPYKMSLADLKKAAFGQ